MGLALSRSIPLPYAVFCPTPEAEEDNRLYSALVSEPFVRELLPASDGCTGLWSVFQMHGPTPLDAIIQKGGKHRLKLFPFPKGNISENSPYLLANYIDPTFIPLLQWFLLSLYLRALLRFTVFDYVSTMYKVQEYGKLKALGATSKQVRSIVFREGMLTALLAIPVGLLTGTGASYGAFSFFLNTFSSNDALGRSAQGGVQQQRASASAGMGLFLCSSSHSVHNSRLPAQAGTDCL